MAKVYYFPFLGGIDLITPPVTVDPGRCLVAENYEVDLYGGYRRIGGYERYDGQASPTTTGAGVPAMIEAQRALIGAVPGSGNVLGVWVLAGVVYALRNTANGLAAAMYKATVAGWVPVTTPALLPDGKYNFINYNFTGATAAASMYGCDGINPAFSFDGVTFTQIYTGMVADSPTFIAAHKKHLFLSFTGGSIQHSAIGDPTTWSPLLGAAEIALGDECTGIEQQTGDAIALFTRNQTHVLYGTSAADWNLRPLSRTTGCIANTNQRLGNMTYYLDDRGVTSLQATQAFGDFIADSISQAVSPLMNALIGNVSTSLQVRSKGQYRIFNTRGEGLVATFSGNKLSGWTTIKYTNPVLCTVSGDDIAGVEVIYFGSSNGFVYQMDKGTSFDGVAVPASLRLHFNHIKSPRTRKRFRRAIVEQEGATLNTPIVYQADFDYGSYTSGQGAAHAISLKGPHTYWNASGWNSFTWSTNDPSSINADMNGTAKNIGLMIYSLLTYEAPYKLTGALIQYDTRRTDRGD